MEGIYLSAGGGELSRDPVVCPAGCWEGDSREVEPDADECYRCPKCASPLVFELDTPPEVLLDDELDEPWIVRIAE